MIKMKQLHILYFSPVGTTKRIAEEIYNGLTPEEVHWIDLSLPENRENPLSFTDEDAVLMVFPVYAGRVVRLPRYFFKKLQGNGARAINVVTYGNRAYDDALLELSQLSKDAGFVNMSAAAFVCEHAFGIGLAEGRPDASDCEKARNFGKLTARKWADDSLDEKGLNIPGEMPFRTQFRHDFGGPLVPETSEACSDCGVCAKSCPAEAIDRVNPRVTDAKRCIACFRCIRHCPKKARAIQLSDFVNHAKWLAETFKERKEPDIFI